jgi:hypothetical protein
MLKEPRKLEEAEINKNLPERMRSETPKAANELRMKNYLWG